MSNLTPTKARVIEHHTGYLLMQTYSGINAYNHISHEEKKHLELSSMKVLIEEFSCIK